MGREPKAAEQLQVVTLGRRTLPLLERAQLMVKSGRVTKKSKDVGRLVKAAETELFLVHRERKWSRYEVPEEGEQWARFDEVFSDNTTISTNKTTETMITAARSEEDYLQAESFDERSDASFDESLDEEEEYSDDQEDGQESEEEWTQQGTSPNETNRGLLGRCNIQWVDLSSPPAPKKKAVKLNSDRASTKPKKKVSGGRICSHNRRVVFHRYDELIDDDGKKDYIYSLHEREVEDELANFDVIDKVEETVSDVGYFFALLKKDLQEEASHRIGRLRRKKKKYKREEEEENTRPTRPNKPRFLYNRGHARPTEV